MKAVASHPLRTRELVAVLLCGLALGCGTETTDLIPALPRDASPSTPGPMAAHCVDASGYPGGGFYKADISETSGLLLNGAAKPAGGVLQLVGAEVTVVGSAYVEQPFAVAASTSIYAHFSMRVGAGTGLMGADGMALVLHADPRGAEALGWLGHGLGYEEVKPSVAIEFDTYFNEGTDPSPYQVAVTAGGMSANHLAWVDPPFRPNDGVVRAVWVDYDASLQLLEVYVSTSPVKPAAPLLSHQGELFPLLASSIFMGLSAASGAEYNEHAALGEAWFLASELPKCRP